MRPIFITLLFFIGLATQAQTNYTIKGRVVQDGTQTPVPGASIFISNSTKGTASAQDGSFELSDVPTGNHEVVISSIGYSTIVYAYKGADLPLYLDVRMKSKASELSAVVVEPDEVNGWERWGKFFLDNFIGTNIDAQNCKLLNRDVLRFKFSKKTNTLTVIADEQLLIENRSLGYNIKYQLEEFNFDFSGRMLDLQATHSSRTKWKASELKAR